MTQDTFKPASPPVFDRPVILERSPIWASIIIWLILGMTTAGITWAAWAKVEQVIPTTGKLEPQGSVVDVKAPTGGVVRQIHVEGGQLVTKGDLLITFDPTAPEADVESLKELRESLMRENQFFTTALNGQTVGPVGSDLESLTRLRANLISENQFLQAQVGGVATAGGGDDFDRNQEQLLAASRSEFNSRVAAASLQVQELREQLQQVEAQLPTAREQLRIARDQLERARDRVFQSQERVRKAEEQVRQSQDQIPTAREQLRTAEDSLQLNIEIRDRIQPLVEEGALSQLQFDRQQQEVLRGQAEVERLKAELLNRRNEVTAREAEVLNRENEVQQQRADVLSRENELEARKSEISRLENERDRLRVAIDRASQQRDNTAALSQKDILTKIAENQKRISEINAQLSRSKLENQKQIARLDGQLARAQQQLQYQELRAPVTGYVFDLEPNAEGYVATERDPNPLLKIVPDAQLEASVYIKNQDIALVLEALRKRKESGEQGVPVEINIEAFPATEFGKVEGILTSIGSDALAPTQERPYYAFPATIELNSQQFILQNNLQISLQSGMAVNANIKIGDRTVLQIFLNRLTRKTNSLETVK
ncbi:HlyD family efflux transporter periplasmic adaptor subunit [Oxynema sp. CENA135]|uniref:HlyD family efflux transporter periplasmic adaptor subunit n=1 Tax=Oxynema sp. CENA135 TaxID=984206 RepID=UPI00190DD352|nr:HlyD family efflux transporter periplasmic adaptor subunit [Oxynema sp. CENA135]MBK4729897.1 HlyD family efflux transporter periplasmic adaptor subunit [Oxynema sp. CENA135]